MRFAFVGKQRGRTRALSASSREVPQAAAMTAGRRRCVIPAFFVIGAAKCRFSGTDCWFCALGAAKCLFPGTDCWFCALRAAKCRFPGTDCWFCALGAAKCLFPGTAADRLSWPAATARRCGGLSAMVLLAAAVASRRSGPQHSDQNVCSAVASWMLLRQRNSSA